MTLNYRHSSLFYRINKYRIDLEMERSLRHNGAVYNYPLIMPVENKRAHIIHRVRKKGATLFLPITLRNANRFSKFFHLHALP